MPKAIHIANSKKRDAEVAVEQQVRKSSTKTVLPNGEEKKNVRILKNTIDYDFNILIEKYNNIEEFQNELKHSDPEVNLESVGQFLSRTNRLYIDQDNNIAYRLNLYQIIYNSEGKEIERQDINKLPSNINTEMPVKWTGKKFPKSEALRKFVFFRKYQIKHINGVTFDFLYNMAKDLYESGSVVLVGGGTKGNDPLLLTRGGNPYRGFLEGRISKDRYILILHLSDIELKPLDL